VPLSRKDKDIKVNLKLHSYRLKFIQELKDMDLNRRVNECARMIQTLHTVVIWTGMDGKRLLGPYFFYGPLKEHIYLDMMQNWFMPQLETLDMNDVA
jgi:hypothetical protein